MASKAQEMYQDYKRYRKILETDDTLDADERHSYEHAIKVIPEQLKYRGYYVRANT